MTMFSLTEDYKGKSLSIFYADGDTETIPETHVSFQPIVDLLFSGAATDEQVRDLTRVLETVARKMSLLSERVSVDGTDVYFDGDPLSGDLTEVIKSLFANGSADLKPLVNFLEKSKTNPSLKSVDDLYRWIKNGDLVIDPDGDIIAYKGVKVNDKTGVSESIHSGTAFVNGEEIRGYIPNAPGTVISMPRSNVDDNEYVACSTGLHAGTYSYASSFAQGRLILVKINPRDVVSVPADSSDQKLRVSRYVVLTQIESRLPSSVYVTAPDDSDDPWYDEDEEDETDEDYFDDDDYDYEGDLLDEDDEPEEDDEDDEEESDLSEELREALERFKARTDVPAKRDSNGRFII